MGDGDASSLAGTLALSSGVLASTLGLMSASLQGRFQGIPEPTSVGLPIQCFEDSRYPGCTQPLPILRARQPTNSLHERINISCSKNYAASGLPDNPGTWLGIGSEYRNPGCHVVEELVGDRRIGPIVR